jgi:hypothetical protein
MDQDGCYAWQQELPQKYTQKPASALADYTSVDQARIDSKH